MADEKARVRVGVRDLEVMADIGVNDAEVGRRQPLIVTVLATVELPNEDVISATIDYRVIADLANGLAEQRIALIETYAHRLADSCLGLGSSGVKVMVAKPRALAAGMAFVVVELGQRSARGEG